MKAIYLAAALSMSGFALAAAPASAAPVAPVAIQAAQPSLLQVQYSHRNDHYDDRRHRPRYVPGHRYKSAPHGWHRYDRRPRDWNRRGCIMVGPVWFCE